jgi:hypothetical protein
MISRKAAKTRRKNRTLITLIGLIFTDFPVLDQCQSASSVQSVFYFFSLRLCGFA